MEKVPPELLSQILSYLLYDTLPIQIGDRQGFVNTELVSPSFVTSALYKAALPKLWSSIVLPTSENAANVLLDILSNSSNICDWIYSICLSTPPKNSTADALARILRLLPRVRKLEIKAPVTVSDEGGVVACWDAYPKSFLRTLEEHIFPSLTDLQVQDLHSIPFESLLPSCPQLKILDLVLNENIQTSVVNVVHSQPPPSEQAIHKVSGLKQLMLRGYWAIQSLRSESWPIQCFTPLGDTAVQLTHLSLNAEGWYEDDIAAARPLLVSHAPTLTTLAFRWCQLFFDFPSDLFQGYLFPSLQQLDLSIEWEHISYDTPDTANMDDIARIVSSAPNLQKLRIDFKPPRRSILQSIASMHWEELDRTLAKKKVFISISADEEDDADGADLPPLFTKEAVWEVLPLALENKLVEVCYYYDGIFDWSIVVSADAGIEM
ncbi:hypothetical protein DL96DRAFT_1622999 [Flagelloscypha sp. PMI_526]|nr:hypothetical protein DL96DRAFT_1622999 [Flagelloscypha sp. PMI_526]